MKVDLPLSTQTAIDYAPLKILPEAPLREAIILMSQGRNDDEMSRKSASTHARPKRSSYILVMGGDTLFGILTERDVVKMMAQGHNFDRGTVGDVMTRQMITLQECNLQHPFTALSVFQKHHIRHLPILNDQGNVVGVVTPSSIRQTLQSSDLFKLRQVEEVMCPQPITAPPEARVLDLARLMATHRVSCVVIAQPNDSVSSAGELTPIGIVTERDIVQYQSLGLNLKTLQARSVMSAPLIYLQPEDNLWFAHQTMERLNVRRLVVQGTQQILVGIITQTSILTTLDPIEMQKTISVLEQQVNQLQDEQIQWLQNHAISLESQVQVTEARFQAIFNQTVQFMWLLEPNGTLIEANQTALDFGGVNREEVISRPFWDTHWWQISSETQQQLKQAIARAAQGAFVRYEVEVLRKNQTATIDFSLRPMIDESGQVKLLIPEGRDISDRKRAEAAQRKSDQHFSNLAKAAPVGIFQTDEIGNYLYVNERWCQISGVSSEAAKGKGWIQGLHSEDQQLVANEWYFAAHANRPFRLEYRFQTETGKETWVFGQAVTEIDSKGQVSGYIGTITNITDRKQAEFDLKQLNQELETRVEQRTSELTTIQEQYLMLYKKTPVMLHSVDAQDQLCTVSDNWLKHLGYTQEEVIGHKFTEFLTSESRNVEEISTFPKYLKTGSCENIPYQVIKKNGEIIDVLLSATSEQDESGHLISRAVMIDVTQRKKIEQELFREKELAQVTLHSIGDAVITTNALGLVEYINPIAETMTGWSASHAANKPLEEVFKIINETTRKSVDNPLQRVLKEESITNLANHKILISKDGTEYCIKDSAAPIKDRNGEIIGAVMVFHDVTQSRQLARQLTWQASHDELTGLFNRRKFEQDLSEVLEDIALDHQSHVVCYLDLDQFKVVNDTCGHMAGDDLLCQVSRLIGTQIRTADRLARLGGDEFGILLKQCPLERAMVIAEKLRRAVQDFRFIWQDKTFSIGVSIGLVVLDQDSQTLANVLSAADSACYAAKERGRNRVHIYHIDDSELMKQRGERQWSIWIKQALEEHRFCLYRQAIVHTSNPSDPHPLHYEILIRMIDEQGELIYPGEFIPAAERYGLMPAIDRWVIQSFFAEVKRTQHPQIPPEERLGEVLHFINLSGASIGDPEFLGFLKEKFAQYAINPHNIGFEITETAAIANLDYAVHFIRDLKQIGCHFALDDFGSGMSSFGYLKTLPIDFLKIDGKFILDIIDDPSTHAIVESINHIGHVMDLKTIAEFVENPALKKKIAKIGIDYMQGYGISNPNPIVPHR